MHIAVRRRRTTEQPFARLVPVASSTPGSSAASSTVGYFPPPLSPTPSVTPTLFSTVGRAHSTITTSNAIGREQAMSSPSTPSTFTMLKERARCEREIKRSKFIAGPISDERSAHSFLAEIQAPRSLPFTHPAPQSPTPPAAAPAPSGPSPADTHINATGWSQSSDIFASGDDCTTPSRHRHRHRHRQSGSCTSSSNVLPTGNICPSGKLGKPGMMAHTAPRRDMLGSETGNYGHESVMRTDATIDEDVEEVTKVKYTPELQGEMRYSLYPQPVRRLRTNGSWTATYVITVIPNFKGEAIG